jgi:membrane-associated protein
MNLEAILHHILSFTGTFDARLVTVVFFACAIGEAATGIPYLMETVWLSSGYNSSTGALSPFFLPLLWLSAQAGRQTGAFILYKFGHLGSLPITKFYRKFSKTSLPDPAQVKDETGKLAPLKGYLSPFSVALGRLMWLRIPLTLTLGATRRLKTLSLGVLLSSVIWDGIYIGLGVLGGNRVLKPAQMVAYSLIGLTALYIATFLVRWLSKRQWRRTGQSNG